MRILLVEDDMQRCRALKEKLESDKSVVIIAENGSDGLKILNEDKDFKLILCDVNMPFMDGYDFSQRVKDDPTVNHIRLCVYSSKILHEDNIKLLKRFKIDRFLENTEPEGICMEIKLSFL